MDKEPTYDELKIKVAELEQQVDHLQKKGVDDSQDLLLEIMAFFRQIPTCNSFKDAAKKIFDQCKQLTGALSGYVALLSEDGEENEVLFLDAGGLPCDVDPELPMPIRGLREVSYRTKEVVYDNNFAESSWMKYMPPGHVKLDNVLFSPININERTVGIIGIANKPNGFCTRDIEIAKIFGDLAAIALTYAESQDLLRTSEEQFRSLFNNVNDAVFVHKLMPDGQPGKLLHVNQTAQDLLGYTKQELESMSPWEWDDPETSSKVIPEAMRHLAQKGKAKFEAILLTKDKQKIYVEVNSIINQIQGQENILSACRDISARKRSEESLKLYEVIVSSAAEPMAVIDKNYTFVLVNKSYEEFWNLSKEKIIGKRVPDVMGSKTFEQTAKPHVDRCLKGETVRYEEWFQSPLKGKRFMSLNYYPNLDSAGEAVGLINISYDMTDQRVVLDKFKKLSHDQQAILNNVPAYIYFKDTKNNIIKTTQSVAAVTGLPIEKIEGRPSSEIYPEMAEKYWADDLKVIKTGKPKRDIIEPLPAKDGQRWIKTDKIPYFEKGRDSASGVIVFCNDITDQKKYETQLQASKDRFIKIFQRTPALITISKIEDGTYLEVNNTFVKSTGYEKKDTIGKTSVEIGFISKKDRNRLKRELLRNGNVQNFEFTLTRHDGSTMICSYFAEIVTLDGKKRILSMATDITDRKHQETLLIKKQTDLEAHGKKLEEMNTALNVLIDHISQEKERFKNDTLKQFEKLVFPYFQSSGNYKEERGLSATLSIIERNTKEILLKGDNKNLLVFSNLTPMESQIAQMIKEGKTSKDIASILNLSVHTVYFHRENVRKKLNITKSNTNLKTYLQTQF